MSRAMIEIRAKFVAVYGENFGRIMFVAECQKKGIDPVTGKKL